MELWRQDLVREESNWPQSTLKYTFDTDIINKSFASLKERYRSTSSSSITAQWSKPNRHTMADDFVIWGQLFEDRLA